MLTRSGRVAEPTRVNQLIAIEDGAIVGALGQSSISPMVATRDALHEVVDVLAPRT